MTSNVGQNYPYSSETEAERAVRIAALVDGPRRAHGQARRGDDAARRATIAGGSGSARRRAAAGILHAAGYAHDLHAVYVVCDGTCAKTFLR